MIKNDSLNRLDDRSVSVAVTHVLAIGITTILIVGLLTAAGGMAEQEQERSAQKQLQMIGSAMANQIERADELGRRGANVTVREEFEGTVSGQSYRVELENDCNAPTIETDACLVLNLTNSDISTTVGVSNRSLVNFEHLGSGTVRIVSEPGGVSGDAPYDPSILEQVGVGGNVYDLPPGTGSRAKVDQPPKARFIIDPDMPQFQEVILLNASKSTDPDSEIVSYTWKFDWNRDGTPDHVITRPKPTTPVFANYSYVGASDVTLIVEDETGETSKKKQLLKVAAVKLDINTKKTGGDPKSPRAEDTTNGVKSALVFRVKNYHKSSASVREMLIDPESSTISTLSEYTDAASGVAFNKGETEIWGESNSLSNTTHISYTTNDDDWDCEDEDSEGFDFPSQGKIVDYIYGGEADIYIPPKYGNYYCQNPTGGPLLIEGENETATLQLQEFRTTTSEKDMTNENVQIGIWYKINDRYYSSRFVVNPERPYPDWFSPSNAKNQAYPDDAGSKTLTVSPNSPKSATLTYDWDILFNETGINPILKNNNKNQNDTRKLEWTPDDLSEPKEVVVQVTVTDEKGNENYIRLMIEVYPN